MAERAISLAALTVLEAGPFEMVRIARACGYSHVGLRPIPAAAGEPHMPILDNHPNRSELHRVLDGEGIAVLDCEIVRLTDAIDWDIMARVVDFAAEFGASRLLVADNDPDHGRSRDSLARLAGLASACGVVPCLEFMPWTCSPNLAAAREKVAGLGNAALLVDAFHLNRSGGSPEDIAPCDPVSYLQLCDIAGPVPALTEEILREARADRLFPGEGEIDLAALIRQTGSVPVSLEVPADRLRLAGVPALERARLAIEASRRLLAAHD
jgi:sugar phosphate isomerase/epimerase